MAVRHYQELIVWQKADGSGDRESTQQPTSFPQKEIFGPARISSGEPQSPIPSNIAEGQGRRSTRDFIPLPFHGLQRVACRSWKRKL